VAVGKTAVSVADPDREQDSAKTGAITKFHDGPPLSAPHRSAPRDLSQPRFCLFLRFFFPAAAPQTRFTRFSSRVRVYERPLDPDASLVRRRGILRSTPGLWRYCRAFGCRCAIFPRRIRIKIPCRNRIAIFALRSSSANRDSILIMHQWRIRICAKRRVDIEM